jgi:hypothetical protein
VATAISVPLYPTSTDIFAILRSVTLDILPAGVEIIRGQVNRVAEPKGADFVVMWPLSMPRLGTNANTYVDCVFTGSIASTTLTVSAVSGNPLFPGKLMANSPVFGVGVAAGTVVVQQLTGTPGGIGTYQLNTPQTVASEKMAAGIEYLTEPVEAVVQLDFHGPQSWNNSATFTNVFRDARGVALFDQEWESRFNGNMAHSLQPLFCEDPKQIPFINAEQAYEDRWIVAAHLAANLTVGMPQQFADTILATLINATTYPP